MTQKIEKFVIKDIGATSFKRLLKKLGACSSGMEYTEGKTLKQFFNQTKNGNWIEWLINNATWLINNATNDASQILDEKLAKLAHRFVNSDLFVKVSSEWRDSDLYISYWDRQSDKAFEKKYEREKAKQYRKYYKVV